MPSAIYHIPVLPNYPIIRQGNVEELEPGYKQRRDANFCEIVIITTILAWMRCSLSFALIRSAVACIRGTRVSLFRHASETNIELGYGESRLFSI